MCECACRTAQRVNPSVVLSQPGKTWQVRLSCRNPEPAHCWEGSQRKSLIITFIPTDSPQCAHRHSNNNSQHPRLLQAAFCGSVLADALQGNSTFFSKALDFPHINESSAVLCVCFISISKQHSLCSFVSSENLKDLLILLNGWPAKNTCKV